MMKLIIFALVLAVTIVSAYDNSAIASARIESCRGCSLNRLPEVKNFVLVDAPQYDRMEVKYITGAKPELILLDQADNELERLPLSHLNRQECNDLVKGKGFVKKASKDSEF